MSGEVGEEDETGAPGNAYLAGQAQTVWDAAGDLARPVSFADSLGLMRTESPPGETKYNSLSSEDFRIPETQPSHINQTVTCTF